MASATRGTFSVEVSAIGVSISPSSSTCVDPASLPNALPMNTAPGTLSRKRLPGCGRMTVTPVRTSSPRTRVVWPTRTPATSVMASRAPRGSVPLRMPISGARGRRTGDCATAARAIRKYTVILCRMELGGYDNAILGPYLGSRALWIGACFNTGEAKIMNWDQMEGKWKQMKGAVRKQWGKLTDDDLEFMAGSKDQFVGRLQERYGIKKEEAQKQADEWLQAQADDKPKVTEHRSGGGAL